MLTLIITEHTPEINNKIYIKQMKEKELSELTNEELLIESKKVKLTPIANAIFIGFLFGVIFYSIVKNTWGILSLIPLFLAYKLIKDSKKNKEMEKLLKERNLK